MIQQIPVLATVLKMLKESYEMYNDISVRFSNNNLSINAEKSNFMIICSQIKVTNLNIQTSTLNLVGKVLHQTGIHIVGSHMSTSCVKKTL